MHVHSLLCREDIGSLKTYLSSLGATLVLTEEELGAAARNGVFKVGIPEAVSSSRQQQWQGQRQDSDMCTLIYLPARPLAFDRLFT